MSFGKKYGAAADVGEFKVPMSIQPKKRDVKYKEKK
jgi:hypothetical protein